MTLDDARAVIAQTQSAAERAAAEQLLNEALALPHLPPEQRDAAVARIRDLERAVPAYQLRSFGASVLESIGDSLTEPARKKVAYAEAVHLAQWYASGATSGGEGTARSRDAQEIEAKLRALEAASLPKHRDAIKSSDNSLSLNQVSPPGAAPPPLPRQARRPAFLTAAGWIFIGAGAIAIPVSLVTSLMILAAGAANADFFGGLVVMGGGPPATLAAGIGLLRRWRWAYGYAVALLIFLAAYNAVQLLRGSRPEVSTVSPDGVINTVLASSVNYPLHLLIIVICAGLLVKLLSPAIRAQFFHRAPTS